VDHDIDHVFEDYPVGGAAAVAAERVVGVELGWRAAAVFGEQGVELDPDRFEQG
jgi:hypothetical protein